VLRVS